MAKVRDRYFVVNIWQGKRYPGIHATEYDTHEEATRTAFMQCQDLLSLSGEIAEQFHVFIGSKNKLREAWPRVQFNT